jgi:hypothetical protein
MKSILILAFSNLDHDARVNRQIDFLKNSYSVTVATFDAQNQHQLPQRRLVKVKPSWSDKIFGAFGLILRKFDYAYRRIYNLDSNLLALNDLAPDLIIANDVETLPLAFELSKNNRVLFDAHEYAPLHFEDKFVWRLLFKRFNEYLCEKYIPRTSGMLTVGEGLAKAYEENYKVKPVIITNANYFRNIHPKLTNSKQIRLVYHGAANASRQLEVMIEALKLLDHRFTLDLILLTPAIANKRTRSYLTKIHRLASANERVKITPPVKSHEIIDLIHQYDVGVFLLPPVNFNHKNALPNKLFDAIQARLAIAVGPTPEMAKIVNTYRLGVVSEDFTSKGFATALRQLTPDNINFFKNNAALAAAQLNAENNKLILNKVVNEILSS